jgi:uncharacterized membrane protein
VNNDHKPDILVGNSCLNHDCSANHGTLGVLLGNGNGTFQSAQTYDPGGGEIFSIATADLNGDGNLDAVVGEPLGVFSRQRGWSISTVSCCPLRERSGSGNCR